MRTARHECQCADRYLLQLHRPDAARRQDGTPQGWLGHHLLRREGLSYLQGSRTQRPVPHRQVGAGAAHQEPRRGQPYPPGQPWLCVAGKYSPFYPRTVGPLLDLCPQRPVDRLQEAGHRATQAGGGYRQRARFLLVARAAGAEIPQAPCQFPCHVPLSGDPVRRAA